MTTNNNISKSSITNIIKSSITNACVSATLASLVFVSSRTIKRSMPIACLFQAPIFGAVSGALNVIHPTNRQNFQLENRFNFDKYHFISGIAEGIVLTAISQLVHRNIYPLTRLFQYTFPIFVTSGYFHRHLFWPQDKQPSIF